MAGAASPQALVARQEQARHLELRARLDGSRGAACWVELKSTEVELSPELVDTYFSEIRPPADASERWKQQQARGVGWRESFRKFIRVELPSTGELPVSMELRQPVGLAMEIVPVGSDPIRAGQPSTYRLLWDGAPLANQWLEFVNERHTLGVWRQTDANGQVRQALPFAGRWLVRSTRLELPEQDTQPWRSRFATLLVHVR